MSENDLDNIKNKNYNDTLDLLKLGFANLKSGDFLNCDIERIGKLIYRVVYMRDNNLFYLQIYNTQTRTDKHIVLGGDIDKAITNVQDEMNKEITRYITVLDKKRSKFVKE